KRFFAHIKDFSRGQRRPTAGEEVRFIDGMDAKGRSCAKRVVFVKEGRGRVGFGGWLWLVLLLPLPLLALREMPWAWWMGAGGMLLVSLITYGMYAHDKKRAESGGWRVAERSLHLAELLGGWPGALIAQRSLRHKCSKASFQVVFWLNVILHQFAAADVLLGHRLSREAMELLKRLAEAP
ncbi:MAG: DUF1294 domain-containing protein, partial [Luteolibacter sp.]